LEAVDQPSSTDIAKLESTIKETTVIKEIENTRVVASNSTVRDTAINLQNTPVMVNDFGLIVINSGVV
jgi:hypothetical protein